jgi:hypothetical protein
MTPQEQKNRLNDIMFHAQRCELYDENHRKYAQMGLGITIYFYGGGNEKGQQKVLDVFRRYKEKYGKHLNGLFSSLQNGRFVKFTEKQFAVTDEKLSSYAGKDKSIFLFIGSERWGDYANDYLCTTLTTSPTGESEFNMLSYLRLAFPIDWLRNAARRSEFEEWVEYLSSEFDVLHGYAGLEYILPYGYHEWEPAEYQVATRYYNVMPNSLAFMGDLDYPDAIKSIAWYTFLGKSLFDRIDPRIWERLVEQYTEITIKAQVNGVNTIKIDDLPDVGDAAELLPLNYQALNEALRPIIKAVPNRLHHLYDVPHFDAVKTYYWIHRWDNPNMKDGVLDKESKTVKTVPILVENGETVRVPYSGIWQPFNHNGKAIYLERGKSFPDVAKPEDLLAQTLWRLTSREDNGELYITPSFK